MPQKVCEKTQEDSPNFNVCRKEENALNKSPDFCRAANGCHNEAQDLLRKSRNEKIGEDVLACV